MPIDIEQYREQFQTALQEVHQLFLLRYVRRNLDGMIWSQPEVFKSSLVYGYLNATYTRTLAIGVRRQTEPSDTRATIGSLLRRIDAHHDELTRDNLGFDLVETLHTTVDTWRPYALSGTDILDPALAQALITKVAAESEVARRWASKRVAHLDNQPAELTFGELEKALDVLGEATRWVFGVFRQGAYLAFLTPDPGKQWLEMFTKPWFDPATFHEIGAHTLDSSVSIDE